MKKELYSYSALLAARESLAKAEADARPAIDAAYDLCLHIADRHLALLPERESLSKYADSVFKADAEARSSIEAAADLCRHIANNLSEKGKLERRRHQAKLRKEEIANRSKVYSGEEQ